MNTLAGNPPILRIELMPSNANIARGRLDAFRSSQAESHRLSGNKIPQLSPQPFSIPLTESLIIQPIRHKWLGDELNAPGQTVPKLKLISQFADMGKDRAQSVFCGYFHQSSRPLKFLARRGHTR